MSGLMTEVVKVDEAKRLVWGWASVVSRGGVPVVDRQGDRIDEPELQAAAHRFMKDHRAARIMHEGEPVGHVVESVVLTEAVQKALGVSVGQTGWFVCMELPAEVVSKVASGHYKMLSIGGRAVRKEITGEA